MSDLKTTYHTQLRKQIGEKLGIKNAMAIPKLVKIVVNSGVGEALADKKVIETMSKQIGIITGQKPLVTHAKRDISTFKLRKGDAVGLKVTLRGDHMYSFFEKIAKIVLPRFRDFQGISRTSFDGKGNYTLGFSEQIAFPEIDYSSVDKIRGLEVTFVTNGKNTQETFALLESMGLPFKKEVK